MQIGAPFVIYAEGESLKEFNPKEGLGDLGTLWALIGKKVKSVTLGGVVDLVFNDKHVVSIARSEGRPRGLIKGRHDMTVEEF